MTAIGTIPTSRKRRVWGSGGGTGSGTPGAASPMLLDLARWGVTQALWLPGTSGNYGSVPDSASLRVTGDLTLIVDAALKDWTPGTAATLEAKWDTTGNQRSYRTRVESSGALSLSLSADGAAESTALSSVALPALDRNRTSVMATWRQSDGRVQFFYSTDGRQTWTQLGSDRTIAIASIFAGTASLNIGARNGGTLDTLLGAVFFAQVRAGLGAAGGAAVVTCELSDPSLVDGDASTTAEGHTLTINRSGNATAELVRRPCLAFTGVEDLLLPDRAALDYESASVGGAVAAGFATRDQTAGRLASKWDFTDHGWELFLIGAGVRRVAVRWLDSPVFPQAVGTAVAADGSWQVAVGVRNAADRKVELWHHGVEAGETNDGTIDCSSSVPVRIGRGRAGVSPYHGLLSWLLIARRALTAAEHAELDAWDGTIASEPSWLREATAVLWIADDPAAAGRYRQANEVVTLAGWTADAEPRARGVVAAA